MKIAFVALPTSPFAFFGHHKVGGGQVNLYNLLHHLPDDYQIDIYTSKVKLYHKLKSNWRVFDFTPRNYYKIPQQINESDYDLVHSNYWFSGKLLLDQNVRFPLIQSFWTLEKVKTEYTPNYEPDAERVFWETEIIKQAKAVIANTSLEKDDLGEYYAANPNKITVIPPGVCADMFHDTNIDKAYRMTKLSRKCDYLLFVGRMDPIKGLPLLLKSVCDLKEYFPKLKLIVTGGSRGDPYFKEIKQIIQDCGLKEIVILTEAKPHDFLHYYYAIAKATVMPSYHESFGLVALESMACGTPVIASNVGGLTTFIKHQKNGLLVQPQDQKSLVSAVMELLTDDNLRTQIGCQARLDSAKYNWNHLISQYTDLYEQEISQ